MLYQPEIIGNRSIRESKKSAFKTLQKEAYEKLKIAFFNAITDPKVVLEDALNWMADIDPVDAINFMSSVIDKKEEVIEDADNDSSFIN